MHHWRDDMNRLKSLFASLALLASAGASGADYPERAVRLIVPFAPGGGMDSPARVLVEPMARALGQAVVVENRPGANATIGAATVVTAPADGYTVLFSILSS